MFTRMHSRQMFVPCCESGVAAGALKKNRCLPSARVATSKPSRNSARAATRNQPLTPEVRTSGSANESAEEQNMQVSKMNQGKTAGFTIAVFFFCLSNAGVLLPAQEVAPRAKWTASWISHPTAPLREPIVLHFKKTFSLPTVPAKFVVDVSGDNRFIFFVNGERVGDGPARGDLANWRYETFDIASHLKAGDNMLSATVWNFGVYSPVAQMSNRTAFLVQGDTDAEAPVNTDDSWMVEEEQGQIAFPRVANGFYAYL